MKWFERRDFEEGAGGLWKELGNSFKTEECERLI